MLNTFDYIKCFENTFWSWDVDERYVNIKGGTTFAHWDEVIQYVSSLAPMGLPAFDVVMGIVASSANDDSDSTSHLIKSCLLADLDDSKRKEQLKIFETISQVESKYKTGENRFLLIATVLEKANVKKIAIVSNKIVEDLNDPEQDFFGSNGKDARIHLRTVVNCFNQLNTFFPDPESIVDAMLGFDMQKLNLENIIPRSSEEPRGEKGSLLEELENETRTEKIAALIPYVLSLIHI